MAETLCPQCGNAISADAPGGVCPYCVLQLGGSGAGGANATANYVPAELPPIEQLSALFPQLEIVELIGHGGMGAVYKARQPSLDRFVALKILLPGIGRDPTFAERFSREARALAKLSHPHIVAVYDSGEAGGLFYLVMEYVDGVNLRQAIRAGQVSPEKALAIVPQICDALQYAHEEGVVHRDIKPENVLLDRKGRVKVADFGLAKLLGHEVRDITLTGTRQAMGTLHYMAPEQYEKPQAVDHRADIYSLGVVFYELLTGKLPLGRFALPSEKVQVDVRLDQVVLKTLEREPERRYQYVSEVRTEVDSIAHSPVPAVPVARHETVFSAGRAMYAPSPPAPPTEISDVGRFLAVLGGLALACLPLLCIGGSLFGHFGTGSDIGLILLSVPVLLIAGIALLICGFSLRRPPAESPAIPPEKQPGATQARREAAMAWLRPPAIALLLLGAIDSALILAVGIASGDAVGRMRDEVTVIFVIMQLVVSIVLCVGAIQMRRAASYGFAIAAACLAILPLHFAWLLGIPIGLWALVVLCRSEVRDAFGIRRREAAQQPTAKAWPAVAVVLVVVAGVLVLPVLLAIGIVVSYASVRVAPNAPAVATSVVETKMERPPDLVLIAWKDGEPAINGEAARWINIAGPQVDQLNVALRDAFDSYRKIEAAHTSQVTNEEGHRVITIKPFKPELAKIEDEFWTKADEIVLNERTQGELRERLKLRETLFQFGSHEQSIAIWKVGTWYHYQWQGGGGVSKGSELPPNLRHLWQPPAEKANDQ
jgi:predicted Ser/Thr protein kinase